LGSFGQSLVIDSGNGCTTKQNDTLHPVFVLSMLEREGGHGHGRAHVKIGTVLLDLARMNGREDITNMVGGGQLYDGIATNTNRRLWIALCLGADNEIGRVLLGLATRGDVVTVAHVLAVIQQDHTTFEWHGC
jgi:hypothetical protein